MCVYISKYFIPPLKSPSQLKYFVQTDTLLHSELPSQTMM